MEAAAAADARAEHTMASPTPSEIRSQAVAKLKRAASLPRTPRRPQESEEILAPSPQPSSTYTPTRDELSPGMLGTHSLSPSPTPERFQGRSTPSPLPTLGELRILSRSNSTAARANAMKKLMGDPSAPDEIVRPTLQRADSLGSRAPEPVRLARSHTVGGGGEERRSAVGRRMMARLGNRAPTDALDPSTEAADLPMETEEPPTLGREIPITVDQQEVLNSPTELAPPEDQRSVSRGTQFSTGTGEEAFEYEHHLRRSMSNRTARAEVDSVRGSVDKERAEPVVEVAGDLPLPKPAFHQHTPHGSTSTVTDGESVLGQMIFTTDRGMSGGSFPVGVDDSPGRDWHPSQASSSRVSKSSDHVETSSTMSWEEISQPEKKSDSIISKLERSLRGTLRKRGSASSEATSPRRGSENSSLARKDSQPSIHRKLSYTSTPHDSRTGSLVASGTSSPLPLPAADGQDLRYLDAKLSPFPGMAQLEDERRRKGEAPRLVHQSSDPVVPTRPPLAAGDSSFSLPGQYIDLPTDLAESSSRQGWLAKTLSHRKRPSVSERMEEPLTPPMAHDPFAAAPLRTPASPRQRSASPAISVVHETDESWRHSEKPIPIKSVEVLERLDAVLRLSGDDPARPTMLDDPPRKLLLCSQVLQVVNNYTVKDRYLFLFTDILVIAKPLLVSNEPATLDMKFVVKSVVSLDTLAVSGLRDEPSDNRTHPVVQSFVVQFAQDPIAAVNYLVERSNPKVDATTLASLLFKTPELDRGQIGLFLSMPDQKTTLRAFIDRFHFTGVGIDDALRMFLLAVRLPTEANASEILLQSFAQRWYEANHSSTAFDRSLALDLVLAIMQLNDALNPTSGFGFAFPNQAITAEDFISAFRAKDTRGAVHDDVLYDIYDSIREDMLVQALPNSRDERPVTVTPTPQKLIYNEWSDPITLRIPHADPEFGIRLHGQGLEFEPSALDFTTTATQTFRVRGTALGVKSLLFDRVGLNAPFYAAIGNTRTFTIERVFMAHTFQLAFINHLGVKRKYCFSVDDAETRRRWGQVLSSQIKRSEGKRLRASETVALQVLRDALIGKDYRRGRSNSVSAAYSHELGTTTHITSDKDSGLLEVQTGKELVLLCRQNSLLPLVLSFLQSGVNVV